MRVATCEGFRLYHGGGSRLQRRGNRRLRLGAPAPVPAPAGPAAERRSQQPGEPLLAGAPEVLDVVVRPARQVGGDPRPLVPELRLQLQHHPLLLCREFAATVARRPITMVNFVINRTRNAEHNKSTAVERRK